MHENDQRSLLWEQAALDLLLSSIQRSSFERVLVMTYNQSERGRVAHKALPRTSTSIVTRHLLARKQRST
jgi:hypothetical protein